LIAKAVRAQVVNRSENQCEYMDHITKKRCTSKYRLQFEHREPFSMGGLNTLENLAHFCSAHNQLSAIKVFGPKIMEAFL